MIRKPYFAPHQISAGKYTPGDEFVLENGVDYIGGYHILQNGMIFTDFKPSPQTQPLYVKNIDLTQDVLDYNYINKLKVSRYVSPVAKTPVVKLDDYSRGEIFRYFVQKRNDPYNTVMEIDVSQYTSVNENNFPGINGVIYNKCMLRWIIARLPADDAHKMNQREIIIAENDFPGIGVYLPNPLEFYK